MTTANTWTREDQRLARLKQADEFAAQEIARMLAEIERGWAEIERLTDLGGDDAVRAAQATEIDRLTEHLAHTRDAANKLYQAAAAFCEGWDHEAITLCFGGLTREQFEALLAALDPCEREATRRDGLERELAALRADVAEKSAEVAATMRRHREEKDALDREVASLRSTPIGQALDLLRRTRAVLHRLDPAHEKLRGEIDALLAGTPVAPQSAPDASLEERAKGAREAYHASPDERLLPPYDQLMKDIKECWRRTVRAVDASRPELPRAPLPEVDAEDLWTDYRAGRGAMYAYERKAFFAGVEAGRRTRAPLTKEEARAWANLIRHRAEAINVTHFHATVEALLALSRGDIPPDVRPAPASSPLGEWQCASCHARETEAHREWCQVEDKAGTIASRATDVRPVAPPTPDLDALRARREELRAKMAGDGGDRSTSPLVALIRELAEIEAQIEATKEGAK